MTTAAEPTAPGTPGSTDLMRGRTLAFSHLGLNCFDLAKMEDFYTRVLGLTVSDRGHLAAADLHIVFLTTDPLDHHQFVLASGRTEGEVRDGPVFGGSLGSAVFQVSFRLSDLTALRNIKARLEAEGITNFTCLSHGNAWGMYTRDPEGNALEFFVDSPWFINQPCGEPLDLTRSDEEIYAETEAFCRTRQGFEPYADWRARMHGVILADQARLG